MGCWLMGTMVGGQEAMEEGGEGEEEGGAFRLLVRFYRCYDHSITSLRNDFTCSSLSIENKKPPRG